MSLLDKLSEDKYSADSGAHPAEGCLHNGVFICIEDGEGWSYSVKRYTGITTEMLKSGAKLSDPEVLIEAEWEACLQIYDLQVEIFQGLKDPSELDKEISAIKTGQTQQQQLNPQPQQQPQQPGQGPQPQTQQAPASPTKGTMQDMLRLLANVNGALGMPVYEIIQEIALLETEENIECDMSEEQVYEIVEQWKRGDFEIDEQGNVTKGEVKMPKREEEEEEEGENDQAQVVPLQTPQQVFGLPDKSTDVPPNGAES